MRRVILLVLAIMVGIGWAVLHRMHRIDEARLPASKTIGGAELVVEKDRIELGDLDYGQQVSLTVPFRNAGNQTLHVREITADCSCVLSELKQREYLPGESGTIKLDFTAKSAPREEVRRTLLIKSNDADSPAVAVVMTGRMQESLHVVPRELDLGKVPLGTPLSARLLVSAYGRRGGFAIDSAKTTLERAAVTVQSVDGDSVAGGSDGALGYLSGSFAQQVLLKAEAPTEIGPIRGAIEIAVGNPRLPPIVVPISAEAVSSFVVEPGIVMLRRTDGSTGRDDEPREIVVRSEHPFAISAGSGDDGIVCELDDPRMSRIHRIKCRLSAGRSGGSPSGTLTFAISGHPFEKELRIPFVSPATAVTQADVTRGLDLSGQR